MMVAHARAVKLFKDVAIKEKLVLYTYANKISVRSIKSRRCSAAELEDIIHNKFILDATYLG